MKVVISYRLSEENIKVLEHLARKRGIPLATLTSNIIDNYLNYYLLLENSNYLLLPRDPLRMILKSVEESKLVPIIEAAVKQIRSTLVSIPPLTDKVIIGSFERWCESNGMKFDWVDENGFTKFICKHNLGRNWSILLIEILSQLLQSEIAQKSIEEASISFELKKDKEISQIEQNIQRRITRNGNF